MANEATLWIETGPPIPFTVGNAVAVEKGAVLVLTDPMTCSGAGATSSGGVCAGIAASEKIASDGKVRLGVYREGIFKGIASGSIVAGEAIQMGGVPNTLITKGIGTTASGQIVGFSMETAADTESFLFELRPQSM